MFFDIKTSISSFIDPDMDYIGMQHLMARLKNLDIDSYRMFYSGPFTHYVWATHDYYHEPAVKDTARELLGSRSTPCSPKKSKVERPIVHSWFRRRMGQSHKRS